MATIIWFWSCLWLQSFAFIHTFSFPVISLCSCSPFWLTPPSCPRERGKPKRGSTYYSFATRQRRLSLSSPTPHTSLVRHSNPSVMPPPSSTQNRMDEYPPMAYVEEEIPAVLVQIPPTSLLYTVLDPQYLPNTPGQSTLGTDSALELDTCIIEEEIPQEECNEEEIPPTSQPPLVTTSEPEWIHTYHLSQDHLDLIFDMRRDMEEQLHQHTILSSRLDMLFDALSGEPNKRRCSVCTQSFIFAPTRPQPHGDKGNPGSPTV
jgi:hypothetical protein